MIITYTLQRSLQMRFLCPLPVALPNSSFCRSIGVQTAAVVTGSSEFNLIKERIAAALTQLFSSSSCAWSTPSFFSCCLGLEYKFLRVYIYQGLGRAVSIHNNIDRIFAFYLPFLQVTMSTKAIFAS